MLYIDTSTHDDYDKVVRYLLEKNVAILHRDKVLMVVAADVSTEFASEMLNSLPLSDFATFGETPLNG
jgi:hypothetical protein